MDPRWRRQGSFASFAAERTNLLLPERRNQSRPGSGCQQISKSIEPFATCCCILLARREGEKLPAVADRPESKRPEIHRSRVPRFLEWRECLCDGFPSWCTPCTGFWVPVSSFWWNNRCPCQAYPFRESVRHSGPQCFGRLCRPRPQSPRTILGPSRSPGAAARDFRARLFRLRASSGGPSRRESIRRPGLFRCCLPNLRGDPV
mmetsp:Transcript_7883/g.23187  ORF Transcript_7883/g.23187 Transcript_7883/m.23187 type:complete len:204 (-) Transcript_7883:633-1244(-)